MKRLFLMLAVLLACFDADASRGYVGNQTIKEVAFLESSGFCGPMKGSCLVLYFENDATGCIPAQNYISVSLNVPFFDEMKAAAFISLTAKKKFRTYATREACGDATQLNPNGFSIYSD